jgi:CheY-like chemotaxis protein
MAKILVIDDDAAIRRLIIRILKNARHEVVEAVNGLDGIKKFQAQKPDLVITDIVMPDQEGVQTIMDIRNAGSKIGVIAMSGGGFGNAHEYLEIAKELGADAILPKPFRAEQLLALVEQWLAPARPGELGGDHSP